MLKGKMIKSAVALICCCTFLAAQAKELKKSFAVDFTKGKVATVGDKTLAARGKGKVTASGLDATKNKICYPLIYKQVGYLNEAQGSIQVVFNPQYPAGDKSLNSPMFGVKKGGIGFAIGTNSRPGGKVYLWTSVRGPNRNNDSAEVLRGVDFKNNTDYEITVTWDEAKLSLYLDGKLLGQADRPQKMFYDTRLKVGGLNEKAMAHGIIKRLVITGNAAQTTATNDKAMAHGIIKRRAITGNAAQSTAASETVALKKWQPYNVKNYGAKGDGVTDDTLAIQKCITDAAKSTRYYYAERAYPEVIIPAGTYLLSKTLVISPKRRAAKGNGMQLTGHGRVILKQTDPNQDIIYVANGYRHIFENLSFEGGKRQIKFFTKNEDRALLLVRNCHFSNSSSYAIDDAMYGVHHSKIIPPYNISFNNGLPELTPNNVANLADIFYTSTIMHITGSSFKNCMKVLRAHADWGIMDNCRIETNPKMHGAAIYSRGVLKLKNIDGLAHVTQGNKQRWIDNIMASVILENVNFDADGDVGLCPVVNRRVYDNGGLYNVAVSIKNSSFKAAGSPENCIVYCEEVPNLVSVINSSEVSGKTIPAINFRPVINKKYLQYVSFPELVKRDPELARIYGYMVSLPRVYSDVVGYKYKNNFAFNLHDNENISTKLPKILEQFADKPLPKNIQQGFNAKPQQVSCAYMKKIFTKTINVRDFGAKGNRSADDSAALQKAIDAAAKADATEVLLPNGIYYITKPLILPKNIALRGLGNACLTGKDQLETILQGKDILNLALRNIGFTQAKNALIVKTNVMDESKILVDNCRFAEIRNLAVSCLSGKGATNEANKTEFLLSNAVFGRVKQILLSNVDNAKLSTSWITTDDKLKNGAIFTNKGSLLLTDTLTVPRMRNARWIDNYGTIVIDDVRFGGEGNRPNNIIESHSSKGKIFMENSWLYCKGKSIIYCAKIPKVIALRNNCGVQADLQTMITVKNAFEDDLVDHFFESCNIPPTTIKTEK